MDERDRKNLTKRYLIWLYKINREAFEKIERKFTQLEIDYSLAREMKIALKEDKFTKLIEELDFYIAKKEKDAQNLKFGSADSTEESAEYAFLRVKLEAIEVLIVRLFGKKEFSKIKELFENEMTTRILQSKDH